MPGKDLGRASNAKQAEQELLAQLEQLSGRKITTREDISEYVRQLERKAEERRSRSRVLKDAVLAILLVFSALQYYFIDVQLQILAQPSVTIFVPTKAPAKLLKS